MCMLVTKSTIAAIKSVFWLVHPVSFWPLVTFHDKKVAMHGAPRCHLLFTLAGKPLYFLLLSWLYAYYCFDYKWSLLGVRLPERLAYFETHWAFFAGRSWGKAVQALITAYPVPDVLEKWPLAHQISIALYLLAALLSTHGCCHSSCKYRLLAIFRSYTQFPWHEPAF